MNNPFSDFNLPNPLGYTQLRKPNSIRRTSNIDVTWPDGKKGNMLFDATARDIRTDPDPSSTPTVLRIDTMSAQLSNDRTILDILSTPSRTNIKQLVGSKGGGHLRKSIEEILPDEFSAGTPLYLLLDDISGSSLVARWAWFHATRDEPAAEENIQQTERTKKMQDICIGFHTNAKQASPEKGPQMNNTSRVLPLTNPEDKQGWHDLKEYTDISFRRARRIDVWRNNDDIHVNAMFQDSASDSADRNSNASQSENGRTAVHEYSIDVIASATTNIIKSAKATPHILPLDSCPAAVVGVKQIIGEPLSELRKTVLELFPRSKGCTHLNDAMRSLAEVPHLVAELN